MIVKDFVYLQQKRATAVQITGRRAAATARQAALVLDRLPALLAVPDFSSLHPDAAGVPPVSTPLLPATGIILLPAPAGYGYLT